MAGETASDAPDPASRNKSGQQREKHASEAGKSSAKRKLSLRLIALAFVATVAAILGQSADYATSKLDVLISAVPLSVEAAQAGKLGSVDWLVSGVVVAEGKTVKDAAIFVVVGDSHGNQFTSQILSPDGKFQTHVQQSFSLSDTTILKDCELPCRPPIDHVEVSAWQNVMWNIINRSGVTVIRPDLAGGTKWTIASMLPLFVAIAMFAASLALAIAPADLFRFVPEMKYYGSILLSIVFTGFMVFFIAATTKELRGSADKHEATSLGFATVYFGTYLERSEGEWILSLTTPPADHTSLPKVFDTPFFKQFFDPSSKESRSLDSKDEQKTTEFPSFQSFPSVTVSRGFGAPLWVLFLAVVGASLYTIKLVVVSSIRPVLLKDTRKLNYVVANIVQHQFYILFAPIGAIFVYQLLLMAGGASEPLTVGLAALASGIVLNAVLDRAWRSALNVVREERGSGSDTSEESANKKRTEA